MKKTISITLLFVIITGAAIYRRQNQPELPPDPGASPRAANAVPLPERLPVPELRKPARAPGPVAIGPKAQVVRAMQLSQKVLRSAAEKSEYRKLLSSVPAISTSVNLLLDTSRKAQSDAGQRARMAAIDFLGSATGWKNNPARPLVIKRISSILERSIDDLKVNHDFKKSLAGDAIELFAVLTDADEEAANKLLAGANENQRRMFEFARHEYRVTGEELID